jgi:hypothetical protein
MIKGHNILWYLRFSLLAALLYAPPMAYYLWSSRFSDIWILYIGNVLFGLVIAWFLLKFNDTRGKGASSMKMSIAGHMTAVMGIIISCIFCTILLLILAPSAFGDPASEDVLKNAPAQMASSKMKGLVSILFLDAVVGNFSTGSFVSILFPFTITKRQEGQAEPGNEVV